MSVLDVEERAVRSVLGRIAKIAAVADRLPPEHADRDVLTGVITEEWAAVPPIRVSTAASILGLDEKTVRAWVREGLLTTAVTQPRVLLDPARLDQVARLVADLRQAGQTRGLLDAVWRRLQDEDLLAHPELVESLTQMGRREGTVVITREDIEGLRAERDRERASSAARTNGDRLPEQRASCPRSSRPRSSGRR